MARPRLERPAVQPLQNAAKRTSTDESSASGSQRKRRRLSRAFDGLACFVLSHKLAASEIARLEDLVERHGGAMVTKDHADVIVTDYFRPETIAPRLPRRFEGVVVHPDFVYDSARAGKRLSFDPYLRGTPVSPASSAASIPRPIRTPTRTRSGMRPPAWQPTKYSCARWTPLVCVNEGLVNELRFIREFRRLDNKSQDRKSGHISYGRSIASIKAYPHRLQQPLPDLPYCGEKVRHLIGQYLRDGVVREAEELRRNERFRVLRELASVYGIGPETARRLYSGEKTGTPVRSLADLRAQCGELYGAALEHMDDLALKIPRAEVEEIAGLVDVHLQAIAPGAVYTIVGGYRRGKPESNDIDIVMTLPDGRSTKHLLAALVQRLGRSGYLVRLINTFGGDSKRPDGAPHYHSSSFDPLDKIFGIWRSPANGTTRPRDVHRRVDLIMTDRKYYATAVFGWTGATQFGRDLRRLAEARGYKFDSGGIFRRHDQAEVFVDSEEAIFELFGLAYVPPEWRNTE